MRNVRGSVARIWTNFVGGFLIAHVAVSMSFRPALADVVTFSVPNGSFYPFAINDAGWITGYSEQNGYYRGFLRTPDGSITKFRVGPRKYFTYAFSINSSGVIAGETVSPEGDDAVGFIRAIDGTITTFKVADTYPTEVRTITDLGVITGTFYGKDKVYHGYIRAADGTVETFDVPDSTGTQPAAINENGVVVGHYDNKKHAFGGFVRTASGEITTFQWPSCKSSYVDGVDSSGDVVGRCAVGTGSDSFIRLNDGSFVEISDQPDRIAASAINKIGDVAGSVYGKKNGFKGFMRTSDGVLTKFNALKPPKATYPTAINSSDVITGYYWVAFANAIGFVFTPKK